MLSAYQYNIEFKRTEVHGNADGLSRLPLPGVGTDESTVADVDIFNIAQMEALPVTVEQLEQPMVMRMGFPGYHYQEWERTSQLWLTWIFSTLRKWKHSL